MVIVLKVEVWFELRKTDTGTPTHFRLYTRKNLTRIIKKLHIQLTTNPSYNFNFIIKIDHSMKS